jgi:hypothetical protein
MMLQPRASSFVFKGEKDIVVGTSSSHPLRSMGCNALRFATKEEAETHVAEFSLVRRTRVVESSDPVNYRWEDGRLVRQD